MKVSEFHFYVDEDFESLFATAAGKLFDVDMVDVFVNGMLVVDGTVTAVAAGDSLLRGMLISAHTVTKLLGTSLLGFLAMREDGTSEYVYSGI